MTNLGELFADEKKLEKLGYVEMSTNIAHLDFTHGSFPSYIRNGQKYMKNELYVPNIATTLTNVGQIMEQGVQDRSNNDNYLIEL